MCMCLCGLVKRPTGSRHALDGGRGGCTCPWAFHSWGQINPALSMASARLPSSLQQRTWRTAFREYRLLVQQLPELAACCSGGVAETGVKRGITVGYIVFLPDAICLGCTEAWDQASTHRYVFKPSSRGCSQIVEIASVFLILWQNLASYPCYKKTERNTKLALM